MTTNRNTIKVTVNPPSEGIPPSFDVSFETAMEMMHLYGLGRWESTAPPPGKVGFLNGSRCENSQQARLQYLLKNVGLLSPEDTYSSLAVRTRNADSTDSKITKHEPKQGLPLSANWYLDCCLSLPQKVAIVEAFLHLGYSRRFVEDAKRFVAGTPFAVH
jgi:hypothetical protein